MIDAVPDRKPLGATVGTVDEVSDAVDMRLDTEMILPVVHDCDEVYDLVRLCASGEHSAWSALFGRFHSRLQTRIRMFLRQQGQDQSLVDDIAGQVWLVLLQQNGRLLRQYQPHRSFLAFLGSIARYEALMRFRTDRRRRGRESGNHRASANGLVTMPDHSRMEFSEFLALLTPREREYVESELVRGNGHCNGSGGRKDKGDLSISRANHWQLRHRIRRKLRQYLER